MLELHSMTDEHAYMTFLIFPHKLANGEWAWWKKVWCFAVEHCLGYDGSIVERTYIEQEAIQPGLTYTNSPKGTHVVDNGRGRPVRCHVTPTPAVTTDS